MRHKPLIYCCKNNSFSHRLRKEANGANFYREGEKGSQETESKCVWFHEVLIQGWFRVRERRKGKVFAKIFL